MSNREKFEAIFKSHVDISCNNKGHYNSRTTELMFYAFEEGTRVPVLLTSSGASNDEIMLELQKIKNMLNSLGNRIYK